MATAIKSPYATELAKAVEAHPGVADLASSQEFLSLFSRLRHDQQFRVVCIINEVGDDPEWMRHLYRGIEDAYAATHQRDRAWHKLDGKLTYTVQTESSIYTIKRNGLRLTDMVCNCFEEKCPERLQLFIVVMF